MFKTSILFLLIFIMSFEALCQQPVTKRSIEKSARADARDFRLNDELWQIYRRNLPRSSDHFKPGTSDVKDPGSLNDSVYVNAYRAEAYKRNRQRRTPWHYIAVGAGVTAGVLFVFAATVHIIFTAAENN